MHRFISYNSRKTIKKYLILFIVTTLIFFIMNSVPGRKEEILSSYPSNPELAEKIISELGLDQPIFTRYKNYIGKFLNGDLGTSSSLFPFQKISFFLFKKFSISFEVGLVAVVLALIIGIPIGIYVGKRLEGIKWYTIATLLVSVGFAVPYFVFGLFIMIGFYKMNLPFIYDITNKFTIFFCRQFH